MPRTYSDGADAETTWAQLQRQWLAVADSPTARFTIARWAADCPSLAGVTTLQQIIDDCRRKKTDAELDALDEVLLTLVRHSQAGDDLAGLTLLQAMLPVLLNLTSRWDVVEISDHADDALHNLVVEFWTVLQHYPADRRPRKIAANVSMDTVKAFRRHNRSMLAAVRAESPVEPGPVADWLQEQRGGRDSRWGRTVQSQDMQAIVGEIGPDSDLLEVVAWAVQQGAISHEEARLLVDTYLPDPPDTTQAQTAERLGMNHATLRVRCHRIAAKVRDAVAAEYASTARAVTPTR